MIGRLTSVEAALAFTLAGNAYLTLRSTKTMQRYTYNMRVVKSSEPPVYTISALSGPDTYRRIGWIAADGQASSNTMYKDSPVYKAFAWYWVWINSKPDLSPDLEVWHEGSCGVCGRQLTVPESIARGIGPECAQRIAATAMLDELL